MAASRKFHVIDYVVFAVTILLSIGIGLIFAFRGGQKTNQEYLMGNRKMKMIPVAISLLVSFMSTIDILGNPAEVYAYGTQYMLYIVALVIGISVGTFVFVPLYYPLKITSVFEYHYMRFRERYVEFFVSVLALIVVLLFNAVLIYSPCMAFQAVSGFPAWASMLISGFATIVYTTLGGMQAVVWTDCFQAGIIFAALLAVVIKGTIETGGVAEVWRINSEWGRVKFFDFSFDPTVRLTFWSVVLLNSILWMTITTAQPSVQRYMALPSIKKAKSTSLIAVPGFVCSGLLTCSCGVTAFAYYAKKGCDPVMSGQITPNEIFPHFVMDILDVPSLPGLFIACLFSASISSVSSSYSAFGAVLWQNFLRIKYSHLPERRQTNITKFATFAFGLASIACAFLVMEMGGTLIQIAYTVIGALGGPLVGTMFVAGLFPRVGPRGIVVGGILGVALCVWMSAGATFSGHYILPLPGPTYNCTMPGVYNLSGNNTPVEATTTFSLGYNVNSTGGNVDPDLIVEPVNLHQPAQQKKTGVHWLYSVSYFYYPAVGIIVVTIVSLLFSIIPRLEPKQVVPKKLLFPCLRGCCGVPDDEEAVDTKSVDIAHELEEKEPLQKPDPNKNDVWVLRDDVTAPLKNNDSAEKESISDNI